MIILFRDNFPFSFNFPHIFPLKTMATNKASLNDFYLISNHHCRIFCNENIYNKTEDRIFHLISKYAFSPDFIFMKNHPKLIIDNNGFTVKSTKKTICSTIKFGEFLNSSHKCIYRVTFKMNAIHNWVGFGFILPSYNKWSHNDWNYGDKDCSMWYERPYDGDNRISGIKTNKFGGEGNWYETGISTITFQLNMIKMKGIIWREEDEGPIDLIWEPMIQFDLIDDIAIAFCLGYNDQTITAIKQEFLFDQE